MLVNSFLTTHSKTGVQATSITRILEHSTSSRRAMYSQTELDFKKWLLNGPLSI